MRHLNERGIEIIKGLKVFPLNLIYALLKCGLLVMVLPLAVTADLLILIWNLFLKFMQMLCLVVTLKPPKGGFIGLLKSRFQKISFPL